MELLYYQTKERRQPFAEWLAALPDSQAVARPGYRVYLGRLGQTLVLLLCGGDKRTQDKDIERAKDYFKDYKVRAARQKPRGAT